jgi:hypothetical protein
MIRKPEDLSQKALLRAKPKERRNQGRPKSKWANEVNSDSLLITCRHREIFFNNIENFFPYNNGFAHIFILDRI